jgi:hypothetical protein
MDMRAVITEALYTLQNKKPVAQGCAAQDAWRQDSDALVREIEKEREEWDQRIDSM